VSLTTSGLGCPAHFPTPQGHEPSFDVPLNEQSAVRFRAEQVPVIAGCIDEHYDLPVRLAPWFGDEVDPHAAHAVVSLIEVVDPQEQPYASRELISNRLRLPLAVSLCEQQRSCRTGWPHNDPPLRPTVIGMRWRVLDKLEAENLDEEPGWPCRSPRR